MKFVFALLMVLICMAPAHAQSIDGSLSALWTENFNVGDGRHGWQATAALGAEHIGLEASFSGAHVQKDLADSTAKWNRHAALFGPRLTTSGRDLRLFGRVLGGVMRDSLNGSQAVWNRGWLAGGGGRYALDEHVGVRAGMDYLRGGNLSGVQVVFGLEVRR